MKRLDPRLQRLAAMAVCGFVLLTFPMLGLARGVWQGIPALFLYLFGVWLLLIAVAGWIIERKGK